MSRETAVWTDPAFKKYLCTILQYQYASKVVVEFEKSDGTIRKMDCTLNLDLIPKFSIPDWSDQDRTKEILDSDALKVYDLEKKAWRSFRWDSIKSVTFTV